MLLAHFHKSWLIWPFFSSLALIFLYLYRLIFKLHHMFIWALLSTFALGKWQQCFTSNSSPPLLCSIIILLFIICSIMMLPVGYYLCCFSFALPMRIWLKHLKLIMEFCVTAEPDFLFPRNDIICLLLREKHSKEFCAMYNICGERSDGKALNCPYGSPSVTVDSF